jgi:outer membrane murein-binding lipoprotein Lpp
MADQNQSNKVQLGCWTLLLIAIIVMVFSGNNQSSQVSSDVRALRQNVEQLERKIDSLTKAIEQQRTAKETK